MPPLEIGPDGAPPGARLTAFARMWDRLEEAGRGLRREEHGLVLHTLLLSALIALAAVVFSYVLRFCQHLFLHRIAQYHAPGLPTEGDALVQTFGPHGVWLIPVVTTLGGLLAGWLIFTFAPEAEGHGTDAAIQAFHRTDGVLRLRVAPIKTIASAITIGSGGAAGREGPVALIGATLGSAYASFLHRDSDRRLLLVVGLAAGLSAIFRSPIGAALLSIEILYRDMDFESGALLYAILGSITAYALSGWALGWSALFQIPPNLAAPHAISYGWYALLGVAAGIVGTLVPVLLYRVHDVFWRMPGPAQLRPAVGGLLLGLLALALPQVLGGGYGWIELAMYGRLTLGMLALLMVGKSLAFALTIGSGGSGGVFAPTLFVGAMLGGLLAHVFHQPTAAFVIVGMAAVFAGAAHVPIANLIMVTEMTGSYQLLVPAALALMVSYLVQIALSSRLRDRGLYQAQVNTRADSPAHHAEHLKIALRILEQRKAPLPTEIGQVNLMSLLMSGIPVNLRDGRRVVVGTVKQEGPVVGREIRALGLHTEDVNILTIIRGEHMMAARPDTKLQAGDRLLMTASEEGLAALDGGVEVGWG